MWFTKHSSEVRRGILHKYTEHFMIQTIRIDAFKSVVTFAFPPKIKTFSIYPAYSNVRTKTIDRRFHGCSFSEKLDFLTTVVIACVISGAGKYDCSCHGDQGVYFPESGKYGGECALEPAANP